MSGTYKRVGGDGKGGQPEVSYTFNWNTGSSVVSSISDRNKYNPQDKLSVVGNSLVPLTSLLMLHRPCDVPSWLGRVSKNHP